MGLLSAGAGASYGEPLLDVESRRTGASLDLERIRLTRKEHELLDYLVKNAGHIVPRRALLANIWGYGEQIRTRTLDVHVRRLRKKLKDKGGQYIETVFGIGYGFRPPDRLS